MTKIDTSTAAVEALLDGVTPGSWCVGNRHTNSGIFSLESGDLVAGTHGSMRNFDRERQLAEQDANARFIAAARDLVPDLLAERDAAIARAEAAEAREARTHDLISRLAYGLDTCLDYLDREAERERRLDKNPCRRKMVKQVRAKLARVAVVDAFAMLGIEQ